MQKLRTLVFHKGSLKAVNSVRSYLKFLIVSKEYIKYTQIEPINDIKINNKNRQQY